MTWFKRRGRRAGFVSLGLAALTITAACGGSGGSGGSGGGASVEDMDPVTIKVATLYGPDNWQSTPMNDYAAAIKKKSGGKINFEFFYASALVAPDEIADGLRDGLVDMAYFVGVYTPAKFPMDDWISKIANISDPDPIGGHLQSIGASVDWAFNEPELMAEFEEQGLKPLIPRVQVIHDYNLLCKDPVTTLSEAKGKKVRIGGPAWADEATDLGMTPVSVAGDEVYTSLQRGLVDCFMGGPADMVGLNLIDLAKQYTPAGFTGFSSYSIAMGQDKWDSLPLPAQQLMWDELPTYMESFASSSFKAVGEFYDLAETKGVTIDQADDQLLGEVKAYQQQVKDGLPKDAPDDVKDPQATIGRFEDANTKWLSIVKDLGLIGLPAGSSIADADPSAWADQLRDEVFQGQRPK